MAKVSASPQKRGGSSRGTLKKVLVIVVIVAYHDTFLEKKIQKILVPISIDFPGSVVCRVTITIDCYC